MAGKGHHIVTNCCLISQYTHTCCSFNIKNDKKNVLLLKHCITVSKTKKKNIINLVYRLNYKYPLYKYNSTVLIYSKIVIMFLYK